MKFSFYLRKNHYHFFTALLFTALLFMTPDGLFAQEWVAHLGSGAPDGALSIQTKKVQYVSRIPLPNGDFAVGKKFDNGSTAFFVVDGAMAKATDYEILVGTSSEILWENVTDGVLPGNAFPAGMRDGNKVYPCTCINPNNEREMIGETKQGLGYCESFGQGKGFRGVVHQITTYKVATTERPMRIERN